MSDTLVPSSPTRPGRRRRVNHCSRRLRRATDPRTALPGLGDAERARTQRVVYRTYCAASRKRDGGRCSREVVSSAASRNSFSRSAEDCLPSHECRARGASVRGSSPRRRHPARWASSGKAACSSSSSRRSRRRIRNWRAPASPRPRHAVDASHLHTGLLAAAVARGQEPLALPAPLPVELAPGPQLERDAPLLIIVFSFVYK